MQNFQGILKHVRGCFSVLFQLAVCTFKDSVSPVRFLKTHLLNACAIKEFWPLSLQPENYIIYYWHFCAEWNTVVK